MKTRLLAIAFAALFPSLAFAQIQPSGNFTPGHAIKSLNTKGTAAGDAGGANGGPPGVGLTELGITNTGLPFCINSGPTTLPYYQICMGASSQGGGLIAYEAKNGAPQLPLSVDVNGTLYPFPGAGNGNVIGPTTTVINDFACWNDTVGSLLKDCTINAVTGPNTAVADNFSSFNGTSGQILKDSGFSAASFALAGGKINITLPALTTNQTTFLGSVGEGAITSTVTRTGGFGQYGNWLSSYLVTAAVPPGQFDVGITSWTGGTNLTGGQVFGGWSGANTPASALGQTYSGGAAIGQEINAGNRWGDFGFQIDVGGARYTAGLQIVPDVVPALDGVNTSAVTSISIGSPAVVTVQSVVAAQDGMGVVFRGSGTLPSPLVAGTPYFVVGASGNTFNISTVPNGTAINTSGSFVAPITVLPSYPGTFAEVFGPSVWGHQWWVGTLMRYDTIVPTGLAHLEHGGSAAAGAPDGWAVVDGYWKNSGLDFSGAAIASGIALKLSGQETIQIGSAQVSGGGTGDIALTTGPGSTGIGALYANNFGNVAFQWSESGGNVFLGFYGASPADQRVGYGTPTNVSKTASLAGTSASLAEVGGTLAALITDLKTLGLIGN